MPKWKLALECPLTAQQRTLIPCWNWSFFENNKKRVILLLMEEILHQMIGSLSVPLFTGIYTSQVAQDFFHQQYYYSMNLSFLNIHGSRCYQCLCPRIFSNMVAPSTENSTCFHPVSTFSKGGKAATAPLRLLPALLGVLWQTNHHQHTLWKRHSHEAWTEMHEWEDWKSLCVCVCVCCARRHTGYI